jgi:hypothetical protein
MTVARLTSFSGFEAAAAVLFTPLSPAAVCSIWRRGVKDPASGKLADAQAHRDGMRSISSASASAAR